MNRVNKHGVVTTIKGYKENEKAIFIHHWFIASCITGKQRTTVEDAPVFDKKLKPNMKGKEDGFRFEDFVQHVADGDDSAKLPKDRFKKARNVWQWKGKPVVHEDVNNAYDLEM